MGIKNSSSNQQSKTVLAVATFLSLGILGFSFAFVGAALPELIDEFGISLSSGSLFPAAVQLAYATLCFLGGLIADFSRKRTVLFIGCLIVVAGGGTVGIPGGFWPNLLLFGVVGIGLGTIFISSNLLVMDLFPDNPGSFLNIHHLTFAMCSFVGPMLMSRMIINGAGWEVPFRLLSGMAAILGVIIIFNRYPLKAPQPWPQPRQFLARLSTLRGPDALLVIFLGFISIGTQFSLMFLLVNYLIDAHGFSVAVASLALSGYYIFLAGGRLACSVLVRRYSNRLIVMILLALLSASILGSVLGGPYIAWGALVLSGLGASGLFPGILAMAGETTHASSRGIVVGTIAFAGGIGGMSVTRVAATASEQVGATAGFWTLFGIVVVGFLMILTLGRNLAPRQIDS